MEEPFLEKESRAANRRIRKLFITLFVVVAALFALIYALTKNSGGLGEFKGIFVAMGGFVLCCTAAMLFKSLFVSKNGANLRLPFGGRSKAEVAAIINRDVADGSVIVDEYLDYSRESKNPRGERIILLPSYLLLTNFLGIFTVIPRDTILCVFFQVGISGRSSFMSRIQIFTDKKVFYAESADIEHCKQICAKLYAAIPNYFGAYEPHVLPYQMEEMYDKKGVEWFREFLEEAKKEPLAGTPAGETAAAFDYGAFEVQLYAQIIRFLENCDASDLYILSVSYAADDYSPLIGIAANTKAHLAAQNPDDYVYCKFCEDEWALSQECAELSKALQDFGKQFRADSDDEAGREEKRAEHTQKIIASCTAALQHVKSDEVYAMFPQLLLNVYAFEHLDNAERKRIFRELNGEAAAAEFAHFLEG